VGDGQHRGDLWLVDGQVRGHGPVHALVLVPVVLRGRGFDRGGPQHHTAALAAQEATAQGGRPQGRAAQQTEIGANMSVSTCGYEHDLKSQTHLLYMTDIIILVFFVFVCLLPAAEFSLTS
jgi:hypothetical protein